jgi:hypothetical protein
MYEETFEHIVERGIVLVALVVVVTPDARGRGSVTAASLLFTRGSLSLRVSNYE